MLRDVDGHIPALCKVVINHTYQQVTCRLVSFFTQQSGEETENQTIHDADVIGGQMDHPR